jgi:hypothetical protein
MEWVIQMLEIGIAIVRRRKLLSRFPFTRNLKLGLTKPKMEGIEIDSQRKLNA